jgi:hypothetical protein
MARRSEHGTREPSGGALTRLRSTAYHEAGHAVAAYWHRIRLDSITIEPDGDCQGHTRIGTPLAKHWLDAGHTGSRGRKRMEAYALLVIAGPAAQRRYRPRSVRSWHGRQDFKNADDLVSYFVGSDAERDAYLHRMSVRANAFVALPDVWRAIGTVADRLIRERRLGRAELRRTIRVSLAGATVEGQRMELPRFRGR